ncbi:major facilitator superfamily domain-containing protein [Flagelloscypha sp. PMI_526]|nr:major facilitator superfamily domain-containing protein [Flagelloscypha sp. PMI_526]
MDHSTENDTTSDEATPFISHEPSNSRKKHPSKLQLAILFLIQSCENITSIYPFVNQLVRSTGITGGDERRTGYYVGFMESLFFLAEGSTSVLWQIASERLGRRPLLLLAPLGLGLTMISFGLSDSFSGLVIARTLQGMFNGDVGVTKTALADLTDSANRAEIMALVPVFLSIGGTVGPFIGGVFSEPVRTWPNTLGKIILFQERPYLLPCLISGIMCLAVFIHAFFELDETHPLFKKRKGVLHLTTNGVQNIRVGPRIFRARSRRASISKLLTRDVVLVLVISSFYTICMISVKSLQALIWSTSIENGGLGFGALAIGNINTAAGILHALLLFLLLGKLMRHLRSKNAMLTYFILSFLSLLLYPVQIYCAQHAKGVGIEVWLVIVLQLFCMSFRSVGYAALLIFSVEVSPNPAAIGIVQGLVQATGVGMKSIGPALASSLFAYTIETNAWGGSMVYVVLSAIHLGAIGAALTLPVV